MLSKVSKQHGIVLMKANSKYLKGSIQVSVYPAEVMNITQGMNDGFSHRGRLTIDDAGKDTGIDNFYAPFDLVIKWKQIIGDKTGVLACSSNKVQTPKGLQYVNIILWHDNDTSDLWVGKYIQQGEAFYQEGTAGFATGNHVHFGTSFGLYTNGYPMIKNSSGNWEIKNEVSPVEVFYVNDTIIKNGKGYSWQTIELNNEIVVNGILDEATLKGLQKRLGTVQDGVLSTPSSMVKELQRRLINGDLI